MKTMDRFNSGLGVRQVLARRVAAAWLVAGIALALAQPARAGWVAAAGGAEASYTQNGTNYHAHIFRTTGTDTFTVTQGGEMEVLVVAGGGGGGQWNAGGGGAGGLIYTSTVVDAGSYSVTVGNGGAGGVGGVLDAEGRSGSIGSDSVFGAFTAFGGGGGGAYSAGLATSGGSGGGGGASPNPTLTAAGTPGQGNAGGAEQSASTFPYAGAGGGGAGAVGESLNPGSGGAGLQYPQFPFAGSPAGWYAGGGGGGGNAASGAGGSGGGGAGQNGGAPASGGTPGVANTGGGGGGGGGTKLGPGGAGGSGVVIIRYPVPMLLTAASGGTETSYTENGTNYHAHVFKTDGTDTLTVTHGGELEVLVVAGGGGGGEWNAGGGGAGGLIYTSTVAAAGSYSVTVGSGGAGGVGGTAHEDGRSGSKGADSVFGAFTAIGGGGGGGYNAGVAGVGGSGGGGRWNGGPETAAGTEGQGHAGGAGQSTADPYAGAGGGGAGADGESWNPGSGGAGLEYPQFAALAGYPAGWFAGGGGGGGNGGAGAGGSGGGGAGQTSGGTPGVANTGGGGGGGGVTGRGPGGAGGSGIVIVRYQTHPNDHLINLDINGFNLATGSPVPGTVKCYSGAAVVGAAGDFWNSAAIEDSTFETLTAPLLKLADGLTSSTVRFSISRPGGLLRGDCREPDNSVNALLADYVYLSHKNQDSDTFTISGLVPSAAYDLYIYCRAGSAATPGRFTIGGINYDSVNDWVTTGDYAFCPGIAADGNGVITGTFSRLTEDGDAVINGLQIVGDFPVSQAEIVNLDLNGFWSGGDMFPAGSGDTYSGAARVGWAGDFWNSAAINDSTCATLTAPSLKLANGITNTTTISFSLSRKGGGYLSANRYGTLNALLNDYVFIPSTSNDTNTFTISGLVPDAAYDLYFYCHAATAYTPGRFVINGLTYDSIDMSFAAGGGGDTAICIGITADSSGAITGDFSKANSGLTAVLNGLQIVGTFPRQHADLVNLDINGYYPVTGDLPPVAGDTYSGAARVGADGDCWNGLTIATETVASITASRLKFADGMTKSAVSFTIGREGGNLNADRIDPANYLNPLLADYVYYYDGTGTFTIAGLVPNTAYDLYFYCGAGRIYNPVHFVINGADYYSFDRWFAGSTYGDHAVCAGIMADGSGSITGTFYQAVPGSATCVCGVQIMGKIPRAPQGTIIILE